MAVTSAMRSRALQASPLLRSPRSPQPSQRRAGHVRCDSSSPHLNMSVDWGTNNIQILFIDRTDTVRARMAVGMFERIAAWNGLTLSLVAYPCGLDAVEAREAIGFDTTAGLMSFAARWKFRPKLFTGPRQQFLPDDVDRFSVLIALDDGIEAEVLAQLSEDRPSEPATYVGKVASLSDFGYYCSDARLLQSGGSGLLDRELRQQLGTQLGNLRPALAAQGVGGGGGSTSDLELESSVSGLVGGAATGYVPSYLRPNIAPLDVRDGPESWDRTMLLLAICCAGLVEYLADCRPPPDAHYDTDA